VRARSLIWFALVAVLVAGILAWHLRDAPERRAAGRNAPDPHPSRETPATEETQVAESGSEPAPPVHDRVLKVRVVSGRGLPVADAEVWVTNDDLDLRLRSDDAGRVDLPTDDPSVIWVAARKEGFRMAEATVFGGVHECEVVLVAAPPLRGRVVRASDGSGIAGARIWIADRVGELDLDEPQSADAEGRFAFAGVPSGTFYSLGVAADGFGNAFVTGHAGDTREELAITLGRGPAIRGVVRGLDGEPAPGVELYLHDPADSLLESSPRAEVIGRYSLRRSARATSDDRGRFVYRGIAPGTYCLRAWGESLQSARLEPIVVTSGDVRVELRLESHAGIRLKGRTPDGQPLPRMRLRLMDTTDDWIHGPRIPYFAHGEALIGPLAAGRYRLRVSPEGWLPAEFEVEVERDRTSVVEFVAVPGERLEGRVVDSRNRPVPGIDVTFWTRDGNPMHAATTSDARGAFVLEGLPAAPGTLEASDWAARFADWERREFMPGAPITITLVDTPRLTARVSPVIPSRILDYSVEAANGYYSGYVPLEADGRLVIHGLPAGSAFRLHFYRPDSAPATKEVDRLAPGEERDLGLIELEEGGTFRGRIRDEDGQPFAGIQVQVTFERYLWSWSALTDEAGEFRFEHLPPGELTVMFMDREGSGRGYDVADWTAKAHHDFVLKRIPPR
jgi:protocatechuate 3,4-dioxygenase beta subunit